MAAWFPSGSFRRVSKGANFLFGHWPAEGALSERRAGRQCERSDGFREAIGRTTGRTPWPRAQECVARPRLQDARSAAVHTGNSAPAWEAHEMHPSQNRDRPRRWARDSRVAIAESDLDSPLLF